MDTAPTAGIPPAPPPIKLGTSRNQCTACLEYFGSDKAFDRHRTGKFARPGEWKGTRRCMTPAEMEAKGMERRPPGVWITGAKPVIAHKAQP